MPCDTAVVWQGIGVRLPSSWEMVRYGMHNARGVCTFMDELRERLQLSWQRDTDCPDFERLLSDLRAREMLPAGSDDGSPPEVRFEALPADTPWGGVVIVKDGETTTRAARYFEEARTLVEVALFWEDVRDIETEAELLQGVRLEAPSPCRRWLAFGIRAALPAKMQLAECRCLPGSAQLVFHGRAALPSVTMRRLAFPSVWLKHSLADWLAGQLPGQSRILDRSVATPPAGHVLETIRSRHGRGRFGRLFGAMVARSDYACLCPAEQRVYHVAAEAASGIGRATPLLPPVSLGCRCGQLLPVDALT